MTTLQAVELQNSEGFWLSGDYKYKDNETFLQDAGRVAALAQFTVVARRQSDLKLIPLTDLSPALTPAFMTCGAIGGTAAEFAALTDAELSIDVNGETIELADMDMSGLDSVSDTPGYLTCAALAVALPIFQAVADAQFGITIDGILNNITCDFSGIDDENDTPGYWTCGANGGNIVAWNAVTDGAFDVTVNGLEINITGADFSTAITLNDVADTINYLAAGRFTVIYDGKLDIYRLVSNKTGEVSTVAVPNAPAAGTDISAAGFLNAAAGATTAGTGGEGTAQTVQDIINAELVGLGFCYMDGDQFVFVSRTAGELSSVAVLSAGAGGTDISGAGFLNGAAGAATAGTGGEGLFESISGIINAHAEGRFTCFFNGDAFVFMSPTAGLPGSIISVLSDPAAGGTSISGAAYLNGLTAVGTITPATGQESTAVPIGIFVGEAITAADLVAGDVDDQLVSGYGDPATFDVNKLILENSLDIDDIVQNTGFSIRQHLTNIGLIASQTDEIFQANPLT
ncbi:MAG: DUF3383 family protein [Actinobacteria bacterium]|nr:DUF3383 family protein [Actinomycetota bacterium]